MLTIEMAIAGLAAERFVWRGSLDEVELSHPTFWGEDGRRIPSHRDREGFRLDRAPGAVVRLRYRARPGGKGRHGLQGIVSSGFASFDGRVLVLPADAAGLRDARIRILRPAGWQVASALEGQGEELRVGPELVADTLAGTCLALGAFERARRRIGSTEFRVFTHSSWGESHRERLNERSFAIFEWFEREVGFDPGAPYAVVWTPDVAGRRVFGGSSASGTCMEHPTESIRNFELLAHRLGHAVNAYPPTGMTLRQSPDHWFQEAWASYVELAALRSSGVSTDDSRFELLHTRYLREQASHPERDVPLVDEPRARGAGVEFLHYVKGPLVVAMLADWVRRNSGTTLEAFMKTAWAEHGRFRSPLPLREALAAFTGLDLDPFWRRAVASRGQVIPVWERPEGSRGPAVATVADEPVSLAYLHFLASHGGFELYADIVEFLEAEMQARAALSGWTGYPDFREPMASLSPAQRHALARHAIALRAERDGMPELERPRVHFAAHPAAGTFTALLGRELGYLAALGQNGVERIAIQAPGSPVVLVIPPEQPLRLLTHWLWSIEKPRAVALEAGRNKISLGVVGAGPKGRTRTLFRPEARSTGDIVEFELRDGDRVLLRRAFWQQTHGGER